MTPAKFGYKIVFSHKGTVQPPIYAYFSDLIDRNGIAQVVWRHAESMLHEENAALPPDLIDASFEERLESSGCRIVSYKRIGND
jgi:hypothetical protein